LQILLNLPVTNVKSSNEKTLGLKNLLFPDMGMCGGPPDRAGFAHNWTDEQLIQQNANSNEAKSPSAEE
jgi:hypothetical protein